MLKHQTVVEFIKERIGKSHMTRIERLELENAVLRNTIACALESIEIAKRTGEEPSIGTIIGHLEFQKEEIEFAMNHGTLDYRLSANTLGDCEWEFERFEQRVILNDGMVMGLEY